MFSYPHNQERLVIHNNQQKEQTLPMPIYDPIIGM